MIPRFDICAVLSRTAGRAIFAVIAALMLQSIASPVRAWDSRTHEMITRLAVEAMPASAFKTFLEQNLKMLEHLAVVPDSVLKRRYGEAEQRRHYIDIDYYGSDDPFSQIDQSLKQTESKFGASNVERWGTLPWTIETAASQLGLRLGYTGHGSADARNCAAILILAGYLSHYVGDATQPLHTTSHFDGFAQDRGVHHRVEDATDHEISRLAARGGAAPQVQTLTSVWSATILELRHSHALVMPLIQGDRAARAQSHGNFAAYERDLMRREGSMITDQVSRAAALLASIWLYEWQRAGRPALCPQAPQIHPRRSHQTIGT
jgi:hypothetical protein